MVKIAHEAPLAIFDLVQEVTDYDYFLVHLFEENEKYLQKALESVKKNRHTILDNSIFELGHSFDADRFATWVERLKPTEYIIPDVLEDAENTVSKVKHWVETYDQIPGRTIGVVQGKSYEEIIWCYKEIAPLVDKIAFSFDYSCLLPKQPSLHMATIECEYMWGRVDLLHSLDFAGIIDRNKPHHLLGCFLPQEFEQYRALTWIDTLDTSNPVVHGINNIRYESHGLYTKVKTKLIDYMDADLDVVQGIDIMYNIKKFREFACG